MSKPLLLVASFGTTRLETCEKNIGVLERGFAESFPGWDVGRAFTSTIVRKVLRARGISIDDVPTALAAAKDRGVRRVAVLPTHVLPGEEFEKLERQAREAAGGFERLLIGKPLLADTGAMLAAVDALSDELKPKAGHCHILMGHGSRHHANAVYAALEHMFRRLGRDDVFIATVGSYPGLEDVERQLRGKSVVSATLAPLMLVAGEHAENDLAGDGPESWKSILSGKGLRIEIALRGLGEYPGLQALYVKHARELVENAGIEETTQCA